MEEDLIRLSESSGGGSDSDSNHHQHHDGIYQHGSVNKAQVEQPRNHHHHHNEFSSSEDQTEKILDNIIVGYAFGQKKMETMGLIMAEASKALSTFECAGVLSSELMNNNNNNQQQQQLNQHRWNTDFLELMEDSSMATSAASTLTNHHNCAGAAGGFDDEEDNRSLCSTPSSHRSQQRGIGGGGSGHSNMGGIQLTFLPDSSGFIHLVSTNNSSSGGSFGGGESVADLSMATTADGTASTYFARKQQQHHHQQQHRGAEKSDGNESASTRSIVGVAYGGKEKFQSTMATVIHRHPIRVSFVPIDLDTPLEEQHGGKFDVILHKMTEDILCMSKMLRPRGQGSSATGDIENNTYNNERVVEYHQNWVNKGVKPLDLITPTDTMTRHQARASRRIQRLREYKKKVHPSCVLVDSPSNILAVMSRADMAEVLSCCLAGVTTKAGIPVRTPRFRVVEEDNELESPGGCDELANEIDHAGFEYPLIAKPLTAAGTKSSHHMGIVLARDGLQRLKTPCLLQEYANHGEMLFKVYVLGNSVWVFSRESLPNLPLGEKEIMMDSNLGEENSRTSPQSRKRQHCESYVEFERPAGSRCYVEFNSQRPYPKISDFGKLHDAPRTKQQRCNPQTTSSQNLHQQQEHGSLPIGHENNLARFVTRDEIEPVTNALRSAFGLDLFGFDVLVKHGERCDKEILVVDVNYFPGYKEVPNFASLLAQYLTQKAVESRLRNCK